MQLATVSITICYSLNSTFRYDTDELKKYTMNIMIKREIEACKDLSGEINRIGNISKNLLLGVKYTCYYKLFCLCYVLFNNKS